MTGAGGTADTVEPINGNGTATLEGTIPAGGTVDARTNLTVDPAATAEPASLTLMSFAALALAWSAGRRSRHAERDGYGSASGESSSRSRCRARVSRGPTACCVTPSRAPRLAT